MIWGIRAIMTDKIKVIGILQQNSTGALQVH